MKILFCTLAFIEKLLMPVDLCKEVICNALCMFNLDPSKTSSPERIFWTGELIFWTPSEKFVPTVGQPHKGKSVRGRH